MWFGIWREKERKIESFKTTAWTFNDVGKTIYILNEHFNDGQFTFSRGTRETGDINSFWNGSQLPVLSRGLLKDHSSF